MASRIETAAHHVWLEFYLACEADRIESDAYVPISRIEVTFPKLSECGVVSKNIIGFALKHLEALGHIEREYISYETEDGVRLTMGGFARAEEALADEQSSLSSASLRRSQVMSGDQGASNSSASHIYEAEGTVYFDEWQPLQIDRSTVEYRAALEALQAAYETIRSDNGFATTEPTTRDAVVDHLESGIDLLENKTPTKAGLRALLIAPLTFIAEKFGGAILGEAAKAAWRKLSEWLISSFGGT